MKAWTCAQYSSTRRVSRPEAGAREQLHVVGPHPRVERHQVGAGEHVDGVDLEHAGAGEGATERPHRRGRVRRVEEALGGERDPARLGAG